MHGLVRQYVECPAERRKDTAVTIAEIDLVLGAVPECVIHRLTIIAWRVHDNFQRCTLVVPPIATKAGAQKIIDLASVLIGGLRDDVAALVDRLQVNQHFAVVLDCPHLDVLVQGRGLLAGNRNRNRNRNRN